MQKFASQLLPDVLHFLRHPHMAGESNSFRFVFPRLITLISWVYVLVFPVALLITLLLKVFNYSGVNAVNELTMNGDFLTLVLLGGVIAPFIEEMTFRLPLRFKPIYLVLSSFFITRIMTVFLLKNYVHSLANSFAAIWGIPLLFMLLFYVVLRLPAVRVRIENVYANHYGALFYFVSILFGLMHITNYSQVQNIIVIVLILGVPQVIVGLFLGFVRVRYGFWYGMLMHSLYNSFLLIPSSLAKYEKDTMLVTLAGVSGLLVFTLFVYGLITLLPALFRYRKERLSITN